MIQIRKRNYFFEKPSFTKVQVSLKQLTRFVVILNKEKVKKTLVLECLLSYHQYAVAIFEFLKPIEELAMLNFARYFGLCLTKAYVFNNFFTNIPCELLE